MSDLRPGAALLALFAVGACGDWTTEPVTELRIDDVSPHPFRAGEPVELRGPGMGRSTVTLDGRPVEVLKRDKGLLRFRADDLPECAAPLPSMELMAEADGHDAVRTVWTRGRPIGLELEIGEHVVLPEADVGCAVAFRREGTYGVAAYRAARSPVTMDDRLRRGRFEVRLTGGAPSTLSARDHLASAAAPGSPLAPWPPNRTPAPDVRVPPGAAGALAAETCQKAPADVGERIRLTKPWHDEEVDYEVVSTSPHYAVLIELDSLRVYTGERVDRARAFAGILEARVQPFLDRVFEAWPDADGDGRLNVLIGEETTASYSGGIGIYPDGCVGDFIRLGHRYMDSPLDARLNNPLATVVHEAMHWYDIGPDLARTRSLQDWSTEAVATLAERLFLWENDGLDPWGNHGMGIVDCPDGATCYRRFLQEDRYGLPGLSHSGGYSHGSYVALYLLQQAVPPGSSLLAALGRVRHRRVPPSDYIPGEPIRYGVALAPFFGAAGGSARTEEELQGEYLLSYYADDVVPGISDRLKLYAYDISDSGPYYPLRSFVLDAVTSEHAFELAVPDGMVFEAAALADAVLTIDPAPSPFALAIVRKR